MLKQILQAARKIESVFERSEALKNITHSLVEIQQYDQALTITDTIECPSKKVEAMTKIAEAYSKAGIQQKASEILEKSLHLTQSSLKDPDNRRSRMEIHELCLSLIVKGYVAIGQYSQAIQVVQNYSYHTQDESSRPIKDSMFLDAAKRTELLKLARAGDVQQLVQTLRVTDDEITREHQTIALAQVACECAKAGQFEFATQALQVAESIGFEKESLTGALKLQALSEIAVKYAEFGQFDLAMQMLQNMEVSGLRTSVLRKIAYKLAEVGQYDQAFNLIETIERIDEKNAALEKLAKQYAETGRYDQALQIVQLIKNTDSRHSVILKVVEKYTDSCQYAEAIRLAKRAWQNDFKSELLVTITEGLRKVEEWKQAFEPLSELLQISAQIENIKAKKNSVLIKIVGEYLRFKQIDKASEILLQALEGTKMIGPSGCKVHSLVDIAIKYVELGQETIASSILSEALQIIEINEPTSGKTISSKADALSLIASAFTEAGQCEQALKIIEKIEISDKFSWSKHGAAMSKCMALTAIAEKYVELNQKDKAVEVLTKILQVPDLEDSSKAGYVATVARIYFSMEE